MINQRAKQLGEYIKKLRKEKKVTAKELGSYVGYSQSYISALENNNNNNVPSKKVLERLTTALWNIGYDYNEVKSQLFEICGYPSPNLITNEVNFKDGYLKYLGAYDNLSDTPLDKPYLDISYLLNNNFDLRFQYKNHDFDEHVSLNEKHKHFIYTMITQLLYTEGIEDQIIKEREKYDEENQKVIEEMKPYQILEDKLDNLRHDLRILNKVKKNFSEESFEKEYENLRVLKFATNETDPEETFTMNNLMLGIELLGKEIEETTKEYDNLDKED